MVSKGVVGRVSTLYPVAHNYSFRPFSSTVNKDNLNIPNDNGITPEGAVFTNSQIQSDWIYREEKDTGRKYYINTKTNEILYNRTRDSELAPRWRRIVASAIDLGVSVSKILKFKDFIS